MTETPPPAPKRARKPKAKIAAKAETVRFPSKSDVVAFIKGSDETIGKREIARAFNIKGADRIELKRLLKELAEDGLISNTSRRFKEPGRLPAVTVIEIRGRDGQGEYYAAPVSWNEAEDGAPPKILVREGGRSSPSPAGVGEHWLARIEPLADGEGYSHTAKPIKRLPREVIADLGVFRARSAGGVIEPVNKKQMKEWRVEAGDLNGALDGELVRFAVSKHPRFGAIKARIVERLGNPESEKSVSLIAIHNHGIPTEFPAALEKELERLESPGLKGREDLRQIPLITIDPADARDHDDAVWAQADDSPDNKGGFIVIVAIADVSFYVRPGSGLDTEAKKRGNSVYFPDRVVPMLPEELSNGLCSLVEEDRPVLAVRMLFGKDGRKLGHAFMRATMRSAAKLSYQQAQAAIDGEPDAKTKPLLERVLKPLWAAYEAVKTARDKRSPLDLDLPERKILLDEQGQVRDIVIPPRLDAHRLIEEFMIQANVAAAETLEEKKSPLLYRAHDAPSDEKINALREFLETLTITLAPGNLRPIQFNRILARAKDTEFSDLVNEVVLRSQAQAEYSSRNVGHFGLNLRRYAHFTSPIRRYADLIVHRALVKSLGFGPGGLSDQDAAEIDKTAEHISQAERRAMAAERETVDRLVAFHLAGHIGATFTGRISGVNKVGLFVRLDETGADGFIPAATLGRDYYRYSERDRALIGERSGETHRLGDNVSVRLADALPAAGALRFELLTDGKPGAPRGKGRPRTDRIGKNQDLKRSKKRRG
ncbi:MAG: ribonuclease R [Chitinophagales bacterium]|nr:ribonuclease R [Hyphomicrobiales bacterium]